MRVFLCFIIILLTVSCGRHDCFDLPDPTVFEFVNVNGQNLVADSIVPLSSTLVMEDIGDTLFRSLQYSVTNDSKLAVKEMGWYDGIKKYRFFITPDSVFYCFVHSSKNPSSGCNNAYKIDSIGFAGNIIASKKADFYQLVIK